MRLAFADEQLRRVCHSSELLLELWGPAWEQAAVCLALLGRAARLGDLRTFACLQVEMAVTGGEVAAAAARIVLVAHEYARVALRPVDEQGRALLVPLGDDVGGLDGVTCVRVLDVACKGRSARRQEAS